MSVVVTTNVRPYSDGKTLSVSPDWIVLIDWLNANVGSVHNDWNLDDVRGPFVKVVILKEERAPMVVLRWG